jgi:hypothetical protein
MQEQGSSVLSIFQFLSRNTIPTTCNSFCLPFRWTKRYLILFDCNISILKSVRFAPSIISQFNMILLLKSDFRRSDGDLGLCHGLSVSLSMFEDT